MADYNPKTLVLEKDSNTYGYASGSFYAECSTAAATQTKAVTISEIKELNAGLSVRIKFTNAQTYNGQPKLQINSLTAKNIVRNGATAAERYEWNAGEILDFVYDGTNFIIFEGAIPTTTYYGSRVKFSSATNSTSEVLAATPKAVKTAYDLANGKVSCTTANVKSALGTGSDTDTFLRNDGTWATPKDMRPIVVELGSITNSGSYTNTFTSSNVASIANVVAGMKPILIECSDPSAFVVAPTISTGNNSITVSCDNMTGTSTLTVTLAQSVDAASATTYQLTSAEAQTLQSEIGTLSSLSTTTKTNLTSAVNEVNSNITKLYSKELSATKSFTANTQIYVDLGNVPNTYACVAIYLTEDDSHITISELACSPSGTNLYFYCRAKSDESGSHTISARAILCDSGKITALT